MRIFAGAVLGLLAGVAVGLWAGPLFTAHPLAFESRFCEGRCALLAESVVSEEVERGSFVSGEEELQQTLSDSWHTIFELAEKIDSLELLVEKLREQELDARQLVECAISTMSDRELHSIVASLAHLSPEVLDEVTDVRAFAARLAEVALEDIVESGRDMSHSDRVVFATRPTMEDPGSLAWDREDVDDSRIYAFFPTERYEQDAVMVRWFRSDRPQILAFERYPINSGEAYGYVWLHPKGGWEPGQYQVDVYSADEEVTPSRRGVIRSSRGPDPLSHYTFSKVPPLAVLRQALFLGACGLSG